MSQRFCELVLEPDRKVSIDFIGIFGPTIGVFQLEKDEGPVLR